MCCVVNATMTPEELRDLIDKALGDESSKEGMALYSGIEALNRTGRFYLLGYNPANRGGNYTQLKDERFKETLWSAYQDQCWHLNDGADCGCISSRKFKSFQNRAQQLIRTLHGVDNEECIRRTFATNAIFLASGDPFTLGDARRRKDLWERHWPIHRRFLSIVQPEYVIALGCGEQNSPYSLLRAKLRGSETEIMGSRWKAFQATDLFCEEIGKSGPLSVVGLYHPSRFSNQHIAWLDYLRHRQQLR